MNSFNDYLVALTCLIAAITVINIINPEVRYGLLRFFTGDSTDAIQKDFWDHALNVPIGMRWGALCEQVEEGRLSFPVKINPIYIDKNLESVPQEVVDRINARKLQ
ncbi:hypothetical protein HOU08_gp255 [Dickeya phage vB_DsoM_JA29]|uniref:Uncharacterized protein n=1 Tax=Dickeya phage vB_DsoM_JA29 TaxID=2283031 RepID=A0A384ZXL5_9CAUD|nr:hypothetical protein HOU08_gp255 [Dickeya phage vB_DsoM_JA29]AXG66981.1 hypothetical protein JA29_255 [Dickeya phage vB_DsoM_JA29]